MRYGGLLIGIACLMLVMLAAFAVVGCAPSHVAPEDPIRFDVPVSDKQADQIAAMRSDSEVDDG